MTREEKVLQNGELVTEIAELNEHVARLEAKTAKVADVLTIFAEQLRTTPENLLSIKAFPTQVRLQTGGPRFLDERDLEGAVDLAGIFRTCDDLRKARARLRDLYELKTKLRLP